MNFVLVDAALVLVTNNPCIETQTRVNMNVALLSSFTAILIEV